MLLSGQLEAAWICGFPFVQYREQLALAAVPLYRGQPLYQFHLIANAANAAKTVEDLRGDVHAFSDPDSNSGFLVTRALVAEMGQSSGALLPPSLFRIRQPQRHPRGRFGPRGQRRYRRLCLRCRRGSRARPVAGSAGRPPLRVARLSADRLPPDGAGQPPHRDAPFGAARHAGQRAGARNSGAPASGWVHARRTQPLRRHRRQVRSRAERSMKPAWLMPRAWPYPCKSHCSWRCLW